MSAYQAISFVFGEQPSAAKWNILGTNDAAFNNGTGIANLEIGGASVTNVKNDYKFSAYLAGAQTSSASAAKILLDTKTGAGFDTGGNFDAVTNHRFTAPVAGFYQFSAQAVVTQSGNLYALLYLYKNGSSVASNEQSGTSTPLNCTLSYLISLAANDYIEIYLQTQNPVAISASSSATYLTGFLVSNT